MKRTPKPKSEKKQKSIEMPVEERQEEMPNNYYCPHCIDAIKNGSYRFGQCQTMKEYREKIGV